MQTNLIHAAHLSKVKRLLFISSSAVYSPNEPQPFKEQSIGDARRELIFVDDFAQVCVFIMQYPQYIPYINIGVGVDISILELAYLIKELTSFQGEIYFDATMPEGATKKWLDISLLKSLGWKANTTLITGLQKTYQDFLSRFV